MRHHLVIFLVISCVFIHGINLKEQEKYILEHNYRNLQKRSYYNTRSNQYINPLLINIRNRFINWCYGILRKSSNAHIFHRFQESQFKYASRYTPLRNGLHKIFNQIQSRQSNIFGTTGVILAIGMLSAFAMGGTMLNDLQTQNDELRTRMSQLESEILTKADISALEVVSSTISAVRSVTTRTCSQLSEVTRCARTAARDGNKNASIRAVNVDRSYGSTASGGISSKQALDTNSLINSNRDFINELALLVEPSCS